MMPPQQQLYNGLARPVYRFILFAYLLLNDRKQDKF